MENEIPILSLITFSPLIGVALVLFFREAQNGLPSKIAALFSTVVSFVLSLHLWFHYDHTTSKLQFVEFLPWIENYGVNYFVGLDGFNFFFILVVAFLTPIALIGSWNIQNRNWQFQIQMLLLQVGMFGCFVALDVLLFYVFFEITLIPLYFLIGIWGGENRLYATVKFFIYTMAGSLLMLIAIIYTALLFNDIYGVWSFNVFDWYDLSSKLPKNTQVVLFLGFAVAFAVKVPLFPFHTWLPDAHYEAPTAGSVQLAAVLLKLGPYGFIRFAIPVFTDAAYLLIPYVAVLSLIGILYAGLIAMVQEKLKKLIAYSSVAHMGYIMLGLFAFNEQGVAGSLIQMINHAIVTGALFLCVGMIYERSHTQEIKKYGGVTSVMPIFAIFFLLFSMASIGLPGLNGFVGEILIMLGTAKLNIWYAIIAAAGVVVAAIYMLWMFQRVMFGKVQNTMVQNLKDLNFREVAILIPLAFWSIFLGVYPQFFLERVNVTVEDYLIQIGAHELYSDNPPTFSDLGKVWFADK